MISVSSSESVSNPLLDNLLEFDTFAWAKHDLGLSFFWFSSGELPKSVPSLAESSNGYLFCSENTFEESGCMSASGSSSESSRFA